MLKSLLLIFSLLYLSEVLTSLLQINFPANVIGMVLLAIMLRRKFIKSELIYPAANILLENLGLLFVPSGVGLIVYFDLLNKNFSAIFISTCLSTFVVIAVVGLLAKFLLKE